MTQATKTAPVPVVANLVADDNRFSFLPAMFGPRLFGRGEALIFHWMGRLSEDYAGGYWNFYTLTNGGYYMALGSDTRLRLEVDGNGFAGEVSADAAGIVASLFALNQLVVGTQGTAYFDLMVERYYQLRDFAKDHPEAGAIFAAID
jgi:hypothetical protein